nr:hypothetical protein CFP56_67246 [Quercus suber]
MERLRSAVTACSCVRGSGEDNSSTRSDFPRDGMNDWTWKPQDNVRATMVLRFFEVSTCFTNKKPSSFESRGPTKWECWFVKCDSWGENL